MGDANEEELEQRRQALIGEQNRQQAAQRAKELEDFRKAEEARKAAEAAKQGKMVADPEEAAPNWPDDGFQAAQPSRMDKVAGALGVGPAGDVALAQRLLNGGQTPLGSVSPSAQQAQSADGAKESTAGTHAAKPALGLG
ncbi:hypothetical protein [Kribbella sp. NPDC004536]|uniref:hypothetical protein n=1 Tax=Kribbella sp. NPDC004536 TaxID=3364106 RepID=UPI00367A1D5F